MSRLLSFEVLATLAVYRRASDIHLGAGLPPLMRIMGNLVATEFDILTPEQIEELCQPLLTAAQRHDYDQAGQLTIGHVLGRVGHFRLAFFRQRSCMQLAARVHSWQIPTPKMLGLPDCFVPDYGLWMITGSGRTTSRISVVQQLAEGENRKIVIMQEVSEYRYSAHLSQLELGPQPARWQQALLEVLREKPDLVVLDSLHDPWRLRVAARLLKEGIAVVAEHPGNGHSEVLACMRDRCSLPTWERLRAGLRGSLSLRLVPDYTGRHLVAACEVILSEPVVSFEDSLCRLVKSGKVGAEDAYAYSDDPKRLRQLLGMDSRNHSTDAGGLFLDGQQ